MGECTSLATSSGYRRREDRGGPKRPWSARTGRPRQVPLAGAHDHGRARSMSRPAAAQGTGPRMDGTGAPKLTIRHPRPATRERTPGTSVPRPASGPPTQFDKEATGDRAGARRDRMGAAGDRTQAANDREASSVDRVLSDQLLRETADSDQGPASLLRLDHSLGGRRVSMRATRRDHGRGGRAVLARELGPGSNPPSIGHRWAHGARSRRCSRRSHRAGRRGHVQRTSAAAIP